MTYIYLPLLLSSVALPALAQSPVPAASTAAAMAADPDTIESIIVIAGQVDAFEIAGSATLLDAEELRVFDYGDINRTLRRVPGVNIQEEDGYGLFPNIGVRGTTVERSENITLMEDGILIAPAPYAAPAAYYFPSAGRMEALEIVKGAAAVRYGPRTIGGAVNLRSTSISDEPVAGLLSAQYGERDYYAVHGWASASTDHVSGLVETWQQGADGFKELDGGGDTGFSREDYVAKLAFHTSEAAATQARVEFKFARAETSANETYLGLSDDDFAANPYRRYAASQNDDFQSQHDQYLVKGVVETPDGITLTAAAYWNDFQRNWFKLEQVDFGDDQGFRSLNSVFDDPGTADNQAALAILRGADSGDGALKLRNNNRVYDSRGIQIGMTAPFDTGAISHTVELSARYHADEEDRLQNEAFYTQTDGDLLLSSVNPIGSNANREAKADAIAFYIEDRIEIGALTLTPGLRYEGITLRRLDYASDDPERNLGATRVRKTNIEEWLPALGATYRFGDGFLALASVSRGFSPPGPGNADARSEKSWNYEAGLRYRSDLIRASVVGFFNDYSNLLGTCTNAVGCTVGDIGDQFNGGAVDVKGVEVGAEADIPLGSFAGGGWRIPLAVTYTYTDTSFQQQFDSNFFGDVETGDELPYIADHQAYLEGGIAGERLSLTLGANYVSEVRTEAGQGTIPAGQRIAGRWVFDLAARFAITDYLGVFARADNLFDADYAVARRPQGLRPGKPQSLIGGLEVRF